jgi:hypothetical protein
MYSMTDDGGGKMQEGLMNVGSFVPAGAKPAELVQPGEGSFHRPPRLAQSATAVAATGDKRMNSQPLKQSAEVLSVVRLVGHERVGATTRRAKGTPAASVSK